LSFQIHDEEKGAEYKRPNGNEHHPELGMFFAVPSQEEKEKRHSDNANQP